MAEDRKEQDLAQAILIAGNQIANGLLQVASAIQALVPKADKLIGTLIPKKGENMLKRVEAPLTVQVGTTGTTVVVETAKGVIVPAIGPIVYASDNTAVATYNPDGTWAAVAVGTCNMSQLDQGNGLTDSTPLTVVAVPPPVADTLVGTLVPNPTK